MSLETEQPTTSRGQRPVPQRTCIGCRQVRPKRDLVRLVVDADGRVVVDPTGKRSGRGAYICRDRGTTCLLEARRRRAIPRAFRVTAVHVDIDALARQLESLIEGPRPVPEATKEETPSPP
jgi:predicted RNA-binding protein YlxR (DUF448 family)